LQVPFVYFVASRPGWYQALYPCYLTHDAPAERMVTLSVGHMLGSEPFLPGEQVERVYAVRTAKQRLHQGRFRGLVLPAYREQCAICRLKEPRLLDAAHIIRDADPEGTAAVRNGLSLCTIHHRAFDQNLVGVSPDYRVEVAGRLLDDEDGPMLDVLKGFHNAQIFLPREPRRPDRDRLAVRFEEFRTATAA
jgi:putative restriction endonuclease